ncbi:MFS transporter [Saccharothrix yanglingensis]|uniref:MFS transporter n=1 Tax=Saccharothrix yanglingensis TaxID=659496 RepID=A0ABU0X0L2_9PSEU|nr:MFS transporter [Saccharothrix yanglingensis]MDQ2585137.1 MFS transporter [Saccharothrix yanglingensis]
MPAVPSDRTYRRLFAAQVVALTGTGLATVALGLLAHDLAGPDAGAVLGTAFALKMVAYVGIGPLAGALAARFPRTRLLVTLDLVRAGVALTLPWVDQVWQVHLLILLLQSASAAFTPTFQATIPDILTDERDYTRALSLSRLAYDLETLLSPLLAAALLLLVGHDLLFVGTSAGFAGSALLVLAAALPTTRTTPADRTTPATLRTPTTRGIRAYLGTPRLRGLLAAHLAVAAAGSAVLVDTVVYVRVLLGRDETAVAVALAAHGLGSLVAALALPRLLDHVTERPVMVRASAALAAALATTAATTAFLDDLRWPALLVLWAAVGAAGSLVLTPAGRLLRRSARTTDLPHLFAADFSLSHACWLLCYPLAGWLATTTSMTTTLLVLAAITAAATAVATRLWPAGDPEVLEHDHHDLTRDHDHLRDAVLVDGRHRHAHTYRIDDLHTRWPT